MAKTLTLHPAVSAVFAAMDKRGWSFLRLGDASGVNPATLKAWAGGASPQLAKLDATAIALGLRIVAVNGGKS